MNMTTLIVMSAELSPAPKWRKYVAIGDSFTEGLNDVDPQNPEAFRGWADLLAANLHARITAVEPQAQFNYANLAIRDRKSTRLNSSHVATSYAVFCLNKKTHAIRQRSPQCSGRT